MKRLHVHIRTSDLQQSIDYYEALFGAAPTQREEDYAKWLLDDPYAHFSISSHGGEGENGVDHVGVSMDAPEALEATAARLKDLGAAIEPEKQTTCCYAHSDKYWTRDPQGALWELFWTFGAADEYGSDPDRREPAASACAAC